MPQRRTTTIRLLRLAMVGAVLIPAAIFAYAAWMGHRNTLRAADERIERNLDVLSEQALKLFQSIDLSLDTVLETTRALSDAQIRTDEKTLHVRLQHIARRLTESESIWVFDRRGAPLVTSLVYPAPAGLNVADRDYFTAHVERDIGTFIGAVLQPRAIANPPFFAISRRRVAPDGSFNGVAEVSVRPQDLGRFYAQLGERVPGAYFAMVREDGTILARFPALIEQPVRLTDQTGFRRQIARDPRGGIYTTGSIVDGVERRIGTRRLPTYPIYVSAGIETGAIRNQWFEAMATDLAFGLPAVLLLVGVIWMALRRTQRLYDEIGRRELAEEALRQAQKMEAVGHLTGGVAHDFNNLLTVVIGNLESAERALQNLTEGARTRLDRAITNAMRGAKRGASITQRLLAFSRRQPLDPKPLDVNKLILGMSDLLRRSVGETIELKTVGGAGLWRVEADPGELEAAMLNLVLNARDAMPDGGRLTLETSNIFLDEDFCRQSGDVRPGPYVMIAVADTGGGMAKEVLERAFEPFFTTKFAGQGTGLGLSQVYGFVRQSGGHVTIESEIGRGTVVKIYLPRLIAEARGEAGLEQRAVASRGHERILVVEDDPDVRAHIVDVLRELNYQVLGAENGTLALAALAHEEIPVDLLLTDVVLPGMNGRELADEVRRRWPETRVLYMTGYSRDAIVHDGRLDPGVELVQKPLTQATLAARVRAVLDAPAYAPSAPG